MRTENKHTFKYTITTNEGQVVYESVLDNPTFEELTQAVYTLRHVFYTFRKVLNKEN